MWTIGSIFRRVTLAILAGLFLATGAMADDQSCRDPLAERHAAIMAGNPGVSFADMKPALIARAVDVFNNVPPASNITADAVRVYVGPFPAALMVLSNGGCIVGHVQLPVAEALRLMQMPGQAS